MNRGAGRTATGENLLDAADRRPGPAPSPAILGKKQWLSGVLALGEQAQLALIVYDETTHCLISNRAQPWPRHNDTQLPRPGFGLLDLSPNPPSRHLLQHLLCDRGLISHGNCDRYAEVLRCDRSMATKVR
jgi:hypothetical protein